MKRKLLILLTTITMLLLFGAVSVNAEIVESGSCGDNVKYTLNDEGVLTISGTGEMKSYSHGNSPFFGKTSIKTIVIENGVTNIGTYAFSNCSNLTSVTIPDSVITIDDEAFRSCNSLTNITIPDGVTSIGCAFSFCSGLTSITICNGVTVIENGAFYGCSALTSINVNSDNQNYTSVDGVLFDKQQTTIIKFPAGKEIDSYILSDGVISIGNGAFSNCSNLKSVTIPDSVITIDDNAFYGCSGLNDISIPNSVTSIGDFAFSSCSGFTSVTIPGNVKSIGEAAFLNCNLSNVTICNGVISIGHRAFASCSITSIAIPDSVTKISSGAFEHCTNLTDVIIGNGVTSIGYSAFNYCSKLETVYYKGAKTEWNKISIGNNNDYLINANIIYNNAGSVIPLNAINITNKSTKIKWQFEIEVGHKYFDSYVYAVIYDEDGNIIRINRVQLELIGNTTVEVEKSAADKSAKIFVWTDNMQPITATKNISL